MRNLFQILNRQDSTLKQIKIVLRRILDTLVFFFVLLNDFGGSWTNSYYKLLLFIVNIRLDLRTENSLQTSKHIDMSYFLLRENY